MKVVVKITKAFKRFAKPLLKKYPSLRSELQKLNTDLINNPYLGTELMPNIYKIRLQIKSKNTGKSGGARIITYHTKETNIIGQTELISETELSVNLISIYDKSEIETLKDYEIINLIKYMEIEG